MNRLLLAILLCCTLVNLSQSTCAQETSEQHSEDVKEFWNAARNGDAPTVERLLQEGVKADSANSYGGTALMFASARGHESVVDLLLAAGANANARDEFYSATPMGWASMKGNVGVAVKLVEAGSKDAVAALSLAIRSNEPEAVKRLLEIHEYSDSERQNAVKTMPKDADESLKEMFVEELKLASEETEKQDTSSEENKTEADAPPSWMPTEEELRNFVGVYALADGTRIEARVKGKALVLIMDGNETVLAPQTENSFQFVNSRAQFKLEDGKPLDLVVVSGKSARKYSILSEEELDKFALSSETSLEADLAISSANWMQFRGNQARGIAEGQNPPTEWDAESENNLLWKSPIEGLGHSCPIVVGDQIFITTAVGEDDAEGIRTGLYGDVDSVEDQSIHQFKLICLNKLTGERIWERIAHTGPPAVKRHLKSTHANATAASDGQHVVAFFGSEGLYCFDTKGNLLWEKDLGFLDSGWFFDASFQWGFASSPIIFEDKVFVQCDIQEDSFIACFNIESGTEIWRTSRDEIPSWSTPTVVHTSQGPQLVTNSTHYSRSYNPYTGEELWRIGKNSEIAVPTPFSAHDLIYVTSGYRPIQPIYAIHPSSRGDISLPKGDDSSDAVAWSLGRGGPYMPSPVCYGDYLYIVSNSGI